MLSFLLDRNFQNINFLCVFISLVVEFSENSEQQENEMNIFFFYLEFFLNAKMYVIYERFLIIWEMQRKCIFF